MTTATTNPSRASRLVLRLGVLLGSRIVEERLFPVGADVTIGTSHRCRLLLPADMAPRNWRLIRWRRGRCELTAHPTMRGRVAWGSDIRDLAPGTCMGLPVGARGRIALGPATVLFQLLALPEVARPRLPSSLRGFSFQVVDRPFAVVLAFSVVFHLAMVLGLRQVDWPRKAMDDIEDFPRVFLRRPAPPRPETRLPKAGEEVVTDGPSDRLKRPKSSVQKIISRPTSESRAELVEKVGKLGLLAVLTAKGQDAASAWRDMLEVGGVNRSQESALAEVRGVAIASADARAGIGWSRASGTIAEVRGIGDAGSRIAVANIGAGQERRVPRVRAEALTLESGSPSQIDEQLLLREVKGRLGAVRACYERALKRNPVLAGKMILHVTISPAGTVAALDFASDTMEDQEMSGCMRGLIMHWRFPGFDGAPVEISLPFVFQAAP